MISNSFKIKNYKKLKKLNSFLLNKNKNDLISILHKTMEIFNYIPKEIIFYISDKLKISRSKIYSVITFYKNFSLQEKGKNVISVCLGTACFVKGSDKILEYISKKLNIKIGKTTIDKKFTLTEVRCLGSCGIAPVITINDKVYGNVTLKKIDKILNEYIKN